MQSKQTAIACDLAHEFLVDLLAQTEQTSTEDAYRQALQTFVNALCPWIDPFDLPASPRKVFTLFEDLQLDEEDGDIVWGVFTPEGSALFRAWLRRRGVDPMVCSS